VGYFKNHHPGVKVTERPRAEIITIGAELLSGSALNTNAQYLGRELTRLGFSLKDQSSCADKKAAIQEALKRALQRSDVICLSGGLGPTPDDVTREALAHFFQVPLVLSKRQYQQIRRYYRKKGKTVPSLVKQEALFPQNARPIFNRYGIALGFFIEDHGRIIIVLPGVPGELVRLFAHHVKPFLKKRFSQLTPASLLVVKTLGLSEPAIMKKLGPSFFKISRFQFGIYPETGEVSLRLYADDIKVIRRLKMHIQKKLGKSIYGFKDVSLEEAIGQKFTKKNWNLSLAESCTGGQIAERLTRIPGASRFFSGGVIAYSDSVKENILSVSRKLLQEKGAVSAETALAMAVGVRHLFGTKLALAVTGIAGPSGGSARKPVGLVYVAISTPKVNKIWKEIYHGDRLQIQDRASKKALKELWQVIRK
jgi:nicotinamide-nucleotide amidase